GGMNVTLEVEMTGLLRSLANDIKDPNFNQALANAELRKANSGADFITLFIDEYRKLEPTRQLATIFAPRSGGKIDFRASNDAVISYIRKEANDAFDRTFQKLTNRIDQFGVAQPAINPNKEKGLINVELPGVKDKDRVRNLLQTTANLQFWETYKITDLQQAFANADKDFDAYMQGTLKDSSNVPADTGK